MAREKVRLRKWSFACTSNGSSCFLFSSIPCDETLLHNAIYASIWKDLNNNFVCRALYLYIVKHVIGRKKDRWRANAREINAQWQKWRVVRDEWQNVCVGSVHRTSFIMSEDGKARAHSSKGRAGKYLSDIVPLKARHVRRVFLGKRWPPQSRDRYGTKGSPDRRQSEHH